MPAADIVIVVPLDDETVAPDAMQVPVMACPFTSPAMLDTFDMVLLPEVTMPVMLLLPVATMVVPAGMPVAVMGCPVTIPAMLDTFVMVLLPAVRLPVAAVATLEVVAFALIVMVLPKEFVPVAVMVVLAGMPVPEIGSPTTPALVDTVLRTLLPETVTAVAVLDAVAGALIVMVVVPTAVITVLAGMPVPVTGCPTAARATDDAFTRRLLPEATTALKVAADLEVSAVSTAPAGMPVPTTFAPTRMLVESVPMAMTAVLPAVVPICVVVASCVL